MKKLFNSLMFLALTALTFTACQDVPEPYDVPGTGSNIPGSPEIPGGEGSGMTPEAPYNAIAAINFGNTLQQNEVSDWRFIKGKVSKIKEQFGTQYGNATFYISDDGGHGNEFYVYQANYLGNQKFAKGDTELKVGDEVIINAKITNYNGTIETKNKEGFVYEINGVNRGGAVYPSESSETTDPGTPSGDGTLDNPFNVAAALAKCKEVGESGTTDNVYAKGYVKTIKKIDTSFGNAEFTISDSKEGGNELTVYRALGPGNQKITDANIIKEGDEVVICGKLVNFKGNTPEFTQGCYIYSINGVTDGGGDTPTSGEAKGTGTETDPFNAMGVINYVSSLPADQESDKDIYIKAKVSAINNNYVADNYGNATFYVSDDGTTNNQFYCFRVLYLGNQKYTSGDLLNVGDEVVICGKVVNYRGNTPETVQNKAYLVSLTPGTGGGSDDGGDATTGDVTKNVSGTTVTLTYTKATASANTISVDFNEQGWENQATPTTVTLTDGTTIGFDKGEGSSTPAFYTATKGVRVYAKNTIAINGSKAIAKVVMECDSYNGTDYVGNALLTATVSGNLFTIINDHTEGKGGVQLRVKTMTITYAQ
jgi:hypothetical protein